MGISKREIFRFLTHPNVYHCQDFWTRKMLYSMANFNPLRYGGTFSAPQKRKQFMCLINTFIHLMTFQCRVLGNFWSILPSSTSTQLNSINYNFNWGWALFPVSDKPPNRPPTRPLTRPPIKVVRWCNLSPVNTLKLT